MFIFLNRVIFVITVLGPVIRPRPDRSRPRGSPTFTKRDPRPRFLMTPICCMLEVKAFGVCLTFFSH